MIVMLTLVTQCTDPECPDVPMLDFDCCAAEVRDAILATGDRGVRVRALTPERAEIERLTAELTAVREAIAAELRRPSRRHWDWLRTLAARIDDAIGVEQ